MQEPEYSQPVARIPKVILPILLAAGLCNAADPAPTAAPEPKPAAPAPKSVVYYMANEDAIDNYKENPAAVRRMVDYVVMATTNTGDVPSAWRSLVKPGDKVGIKISAAGGKYFSTHHAVVEAILEGLESAGIPRKDVIVWDRAGLAEAGYSEKKEGFQVRSIEPVRGYDSEAVISSSVAGKLIWGDVDFVKRDPKNPLAPIDKDQHSADSHLCKILAHDVTKIINVPVLSASEECGVAGALYNVTVPNVDNWRRYGENDTFICDLYTDPNIGQKVVINIMDGLIAQYAGGPGFQANYAVHHGRIYASKDPVALDVVALQEIEQWRVQAKLPRVAPYAAYLLTAASMGIGAVEPGRIEVRSIEPNH